MRTTLMKTVLSASAVLVGGGWTMALASSAPMPITPAKWPLVYQQTVSTFPITAGVVQQTTHFSTLGGPLQANVLSVDLTNPNTKLGVVLANNQVYSKDETVSSMAGRTGAVGGVNGDFFEIGASGRPENLVVSNGTVLQSQLPGGYAVIGITSDGHVTIGPETFQGQVTVTTFVPPGADASGGTTVTSATYGTSGSNSFPLIAVNRPGQENNGNLAMITPAMGSLVYTKSDTVAYLLPESGSNDTYQVSSVKTGVKAIRPLTDEVALVAGGGAAANWLETSLAPGDIVKVQEGITPDANIVQAVGSGYQLLKNGQWYDDPDALGRFAMDQQNPLTAVGVTKDGQHAFLVVFDGRNGVSAGLTYRQMAAYLQSLGAWNAAMLDGGGSTEMVAREPGDQTVSVLNDPSDGQERPVADGLFVYSTEAVTGLPSQVVVNQGNPLALMVGALSSITDYAVDSVGNPSTSPLQLTVQPSTLAKVHGNQIIATSAGTGTVTATAANGVSASVPLTVVARPSSIMMSPTANDLAPGQAITFTASALDAQGAPVTIPANEWQWTTSNARVGTVSPNGVFQATPQTVWTHFPATSDITVQASVYGTVGQSKVQVGYQPTMLNDMTKPSDWILSSKADGTIKAARYPIARPTDKGSMRIAYDYPVGKGSEQVVFWPKHTMTLRPDQAGDDPTGIGFWLKGNDSQVNLAVSVTSESGQRVTMYPTTVNFQGWRYITVPFPESLGSTVTINFLDVLVGSPTKELKGTLYMSDLQALYPRSTWVHSPSLAMPNWFQEVPSTSKFSSSGTTIAAVAGARVSAADPHGIGPNDLNSIKTAVHRYAKRWSHSTVAVQWLGDMVKAGSMGDFQAVAKWMKSFDVPVHAAVGSTEIRKTSESGYFHKVLGATHYAYTVGSTTVMVMDDAHGGLTASDASQQPAEGQLHWLSNTLTKTDAKTVLLVMEQGAYSSTPGDTTSTMSGSDAQVLESLAQDYTQAHPGAHVVVLSSDNNQSSARQLNPSGQDTPQGGIVNVTIPELTTPSGQPSPHAAYVWIHITKTGTVQWTVQSQGGRS